MRPLLAILCLWLPFVVSGLLAAYFTFYNRIEGVALSAKGVKAWRRQTKERKEKQEAERGNGWQKRF